MARHPSLLGRLAPIAVVVAVLTGPSGASASKVISVHYDTVLSLNGTDILCTVLKQGSGSSVACFHAPGGPSSSVRKGYAIAASDQYVAVEPPTTTTPVALYRQPSLASQPRIVGGSSHATLVTLALNDIARVGGTHMAVLVTTAKGGGAAIGVVYVDAKGEPLVGTYTVGISDHYVTIARVSGATQTQVIYRHAVY